MGPQEVANAFEENGDAMGYTTYDGEDAPRSRVISPINTTFSGNIRVCNGTVFTRDVMGCDGLAINFVSTANFQQGLNTDTIAPFSSNTVVVNGALDAHKVSTNEVHTDNIYPETSNVVTVHGGLEADFVSANTIYANNIQAPGGGPVTTDNFDVHILTVDEIYSTDDLEVHSNTVFDRDVRICGGILRVSDIEPCGTTLHIGGNVSFDNVHFGTLSANNFVANSITTQSATIQNLVSNSIQTNSVTTVNLASQNASIQNLVSNAISTNAITTLNLIAQNANITDLTVTNLHVQQINLQDATIINLHVQNLDTQNLEAQIANLIYLNVQEIDVSVLNAQDAQIQNLEAQSANLVQANILDLTVDNLHVIQTAYLQNATVQNLVGQVANFVQANITDLIAINVDADSVSTEVLTALAADVVTINVQELDAQVANIDELTVNTLHVQTLNLQDVSVMNLEAQFANLIQATIDDLTVNTLHVQNIDLQNANITNLSVQNLEAQVANLVQATITNLVSVDVTTTNLNAQNANLNHIVAIDVTAQVANFVQVTTDNLDANFASIDVLVTNAFSANAASIDVLQVQTIGNPDGELVFTSDSSFCGVNLAVSNLVACSPNGTINVNDNLVLSKNLVVNGTITTTGPPSIPFVGARVLLSSDQTLGIAITVTNVAFDTVDYDTNSMWNNTTKAFLLPYNGYYEVLSSLGSSATVSIGALREIDLMKNGTAVPGTQDSSPLTIGLLTSGSSSMKIADTIRCNAGDTLYIQYSGVALDVLGADGSAFSIKLVGTF